MKEFIVGVENREAYETVKSMIESNGRDVNPLVITSGEQGIGKTHLVSWMKEELEKKGKRVILTNDQEFTNAICRMVDTYTGDFATACAGMFDKADALILEDVESFWYKLRTQETIEDILEILIKNGVMVILTGKVTPREGRHLHNRLVMFSRNGRHVMLKPPGDWLKCAMIAQKAEAEGLSLDVNLTQMIASGIENGWQIDGVLCQIRGHMEIEGMELNEELVKQAIKEKGFA